MAYRRRKRISRDSIREFTQAVSQWLNAREMDDMIYFTSTEWLLFQDHFTIRFSSLRTAKNMMTPATHTI